MNIRLYNTLGRIKQPFHPLGSGPVGIYSCGPTVYARQHIGNLRPYVFADLLKRTLREFGYPVRHVINITDVGHLTSDADFGDDKMERAARASGASALHIAAHWTELFQRDLARLGLEPPDVWARASEHIAEQIAMIERLEARGFTYALPDGIYFDTSRDPSYGALAGLVASAEHARVAAAAEKRSSADFALWKLSPSEGPRRQLEWPSPWGVGFPGWHIECSAMATKYLGQTFEIHTGGVDHVAVHHTNEIAQSENALELRPWVHFWMHGGWLTVGGQKVSKSQGPTPNLDDLLAAGISAQAYRYYLLTAHYRAPLAFSLEAVRAAQAAFERLTALAQDPADMPEGAQRLRVAFRAALADDLNAPLALSVLWEAARDTSLSRGARARLLLELGGILGLDLGVAPKPEQPDPEVDALLGERELARRRRDFARADAIRSELSRRGITIEDTSQGPRRYRG